MPLTEVSTANFRIAPSAMRKMLVPMPMWSWYPLGAGFNAVLAEALLRVEHDRRARPRGRLAVDERVPVQILELHGQAALGRRDLAVGERVDLRALHAEAGRQRRGEERPVQRLGGRRGLRILALVHGDLPLVGPRGHRAGGDVEDARV